MPRSGTRPPDERDTSARPPDERDTSAGPPGTRDTTPKPRVRIAVRVIPRGGRSAIDGVRDGELVVRLAAPPVEGAANEELLRVLARSLDVPPTSLRIERGARGRRKVVSAPAAAAARVAALLR